MTSKTFLSADFHISHRLVSGLRGFWTTDQDGEKVPDTAAHDAALAANWDAVVGPDDLVYILGDLSINSGVQVDEWISARPGRKRLISGNHDKTHSAIFKRTKKGVEAVWERWTPLFESILDEDTIEIGGRTVTLSHFPSWDWGDGPGREEHTRYENLRPWVGKDTIILHGHTHGTEVAHGREYHVGLDAHDLQLVPESVIADWIKTLD